MILIISDVHGRFGVINEQLEYAAKVMGENIEAVVVLGDLGIFESNLKKFFEREKQKFIKPLYFIEGNHEDFSCFDILVKKYGENLTHWHKSSIQKLGGVNFLCLGGARYMDLANTPMNSEIKTSDISNCLIHSPQAAQVIITHDCPEGIGVPNTPGLEFYGPPGFSGSCEILKHFKPRLWLFGHHHKWFDKIIDGTAFHGLPESWNGFGLLGPDLSFRPVVNLIERKYEPFWKRWFGGL